MNGYGSSATVSKLKTPVPPGGSSPSSSLTNDRWDTLRRRYSGGSTYYVRGHLLNDNLGGPGGAWSNLTPLTQDANNRGQDSHLHGFETPVKRAVLEEGKIVSFSVVANYGRSPRQDQIDYHAAQGNEDDTAIAAIIRAERDIPTTFSCSSRETDASGAPVAGGFSATHTVQNAIDENPENYRLSAAQSRTVYLSDLDAADYTSTFGLDQETATVLAAGGPYRSWTAVRNATGVEVETRIRNTSGVRARLFRRT